MAKKRLRIAVIAPSFFSLPPAYGGVEEVIVNLVRGLLSFAGLQYAYEVVVFSAQGSEIEGAQVELFAPYFPQNAVEWAAFDEASTARAYHLIYSGQYGEFDIISDHTVPGPALAYAMSCREGFIPTLITLHNTLPSRYLPSFLSQFPLQVPIAYAAIARHELEAARQMGIRNISLCYNGENVEANIQQAQTVEKENYFSFLARIHPDKDVVRACRLCVAAGVTLRIAGRVNDQRYFREEVQPLLETYPDLLQYVGEIAPEEKVQFLAASKGFVFPVRWAEGFGMSIVQSWSCGVPVIGSRNGSLTELIDPAPAAGLASESDQAMIEALQAIAQDSGRFNSEACFARARDFSVERMVESYERAFIPLLHWD